MKDDFGTMLTLAADDGDPACTPSMLLPVDAAELIASSELSGDDDEATAADSGELDEATGCNGGCKKLVGEGPDTWPTVAETGGHTHIHARTHTQAWSTHGQITHVNYKDLYTLSSLS